ncbi:MAG: phage tail family protein [Lachnospiraceae bacterium]|nr:phage tail family protein [Lachnospiraceae bacterium]
MIENVILLNKVTKDVIELDVSKTPYYILDSVDWGQVKSEHHTYKYVNQIGVYVTGTSLETREIEITGWIIAKTESQMDERKKVLNGFVNPQQMINLTYKQYDLEFLPNTSIKYSTTLVENNDVVCKFKIDGLCPDPLFRDSLESKVAVATTVGMFHFPMIINKIQQQPPQLLFGLRKPSLIVNIYNSGAERTGMKMVFKATSTIKNPSFVNVRTQEYFKINKTMIAGETVTVNTTTGEKKVIGFLNGEEQNYFKYRDLDSSWLQLEVGDNLFRYDADENIDGLETYIYFYNRYLEVQECY